MSTTSTPLDIEVPNFGKVPVQVNHGKDLNDPIDVTHRPPDTRRQTDNNSDPRLRFKNPRIVQVLDAGNRFLLPQYAVVRNKIVKVSQSQLDRLLAKTLLIATADDRGNIGQELAARIVVGDCPEPDVDANGEVQYMVLLDWDQETVRLNSFPAVLLFDPVTRVVTPLIDQTDQQDNFLVSVSSDGPHDPPPHPPAAFGPLNTQPSDFRPATDDDKKYYEQDSRQDDSPSVAVMDTGLKFNLLNRGHEHDWPAHTYRDANGQERRFVLAYQDQPTVAGCKEEMASNHLGYCALLSYREEDFIKNMKLLTTTGPDTPYSWPDVMNSPFDDFQLFTDPDDAGRLVDARHGTSVTALIQQNGDDAPVLPVKVFDNIGFATLFDVLNGFNYVLQRCKTTNIRVVNTSWIFGQDNPMLKRKIKQLRDAGVFIVAAAGNEGQTLNRDLDNVPVYPACYSTEFSNVITVTSIRKTYFRPDLLAPKEDSLVGKALAKAVSFGLFNVLESADDVLEAVLPTAGYVAVENYSVNYVNVGVVSTFGYFRSPFYNGPIIRGSSYACALVSGFVIRQLRTDTMLLDLIKSGSEAAMRIARQQLLDAMSRSGPDENLKNEYVNGGYYLDGYAVD